MSLEKKLNKRLIGLIMGEKYTKDIEKEEKPGFLEKWIIELKKNLFSKKNTSKKTTDTKQDIIEWKKIGESDSPDEEEW